MATILACSIPATIKASSVPRSGKKSDPNPRKPVWWAPLFGISSDPDYMTSSPLQAEKPEMPSGSGLVRQQRFVPGCFTEEKARQLRRKMVESSAFHDVMYHSAIASRLASDVPGRVEK